MKQMGVVVSTEGSTARVSIERHSSCGSCSACKMGQEDAKVEINATNGVKATVGQWVTVDMEDQDVLAAAFMVYVIPLFALLAGIFVGNFIFTALGVEKFIDIYAALFGFATMAIAFLRLKMKEKTLKHNKRFLSQIIEIVDVENMCH